MANSKKLGITGIISFFRKIIGYTGYITAIVQIIEYAVDLLGKVSNDDQKAK